MIISDFEVTDFLAMEVDESSEASNSDLSGHLNPFEACRVLLLIDIDRSETTFFTIK